MKNHNLRFSMIVALILGGVQATQAGIITFTNTSPITINDFGNASPYPAAITISGLNAPILDINVVINGLSHTFPSDIGILLVGPGGQKVVLMDFVGGINPVTNVNLLFDDEAASGISNSTISSGSFKPTNLALDDVFNPPRWPQVPTHHRYLSLTIRLPMAPGVCLSKISPPAMAAA